MKSRGCTVEFRVSKILSFLIILCFFSRGPQHLRCWPAASREGRCRIWILNSLCSTAMLSSTGIYSCKAQFPDDLCLNTLTFHSSICNFPYPLSDFPEFFPPSSNSLLSLPSGDRLLSGILKGCSWGWPADLLPWELRSKDSIYPSHTEGHKQQFPVLPFSLVKVCPPLFHKGHWKAVP